MLPIVRSSIAHMCLTLQILRSDQSAHAGRDIGGIRPASAAMLSTSRCLPTLVLRSASGSSYSPYLQHLSSSVIVNLNSFGCYVVCEEI